VKLAVVFASLVLAACTGDSPADPASPATSSSNGSGGIGGGGAGGASSMSGSGGVSADLCGNLCTKFEQLGCDLSACKSLCPKWIERAGDCGPQMAAEIDCIADSTTKCGQDVCHEEFAALDACAGGVDCFGQSCKGLGAGRADTCECSAGCSTGLAHVTCVTNNQMTSCQCFVGGRQVGTCEQAESFCDLDYGCCKTYF